MGSAWAGRYYDVDGGSLSGVRMFFA